MRSISDHVLIDMYDMRRLKPVAKKLFEAEFDIELEISTELS